MSANDMTYKKLLQDDLIKIKQELLLELPLSIMSDDDKDYFIQKINITSSFNHLCGYNDSYKFNDKTKELLLKYNLLVDCLYYDR